MKKETSLGRILLLAGGALAVLFVAYQFFLAPLQRYNAQIDGLKQEIEDTTKEARQIRKALPQLQRWRQQSLPPDPYRSGDTSVAQREYAGYLADLFYRSGVKDLSWSSVNVAAGSEKGFGAKKPVFTRVAFTADFKTGKTTLAELLQRFQRTPLVHKIQNIKIEPADAKGGKGKTDDLHVHMMIEALVVDGADPVQPTLEPYLVGTDGHLIELDTLNALGRGPSWMTLLSGVARPRNYTMIASRDIFTGPRAVDRSKMINVSPYVRLTKITHEGKNSEAILRNLLSNDPKGIRLVAASNESTFRVVDLDGKELVQGQVLLITDRDVYFRARWGIFVLHMGQNLGEALRRPVPPDFLPDELQMFNEDDGGF
jgi:hypothetical protein